MKRVALFALIITTALLFSGCQEETTEAYPQYKAKIISITEQVSESNQEYDEIELEVLEGPYEGEIFKVTSAIKVEHYKDLELYHINDRVFLELYESIETGETNAVIMSQVRLPWLTAFFILFLAAIVLIGGKKGLKTIVALILTIGSVVFILIPLVSKGYNPIFSALLCGALISSITLTIVGGINRKTLSAVLGTLSGLICATILTIVASRLLRVTGITSEDVEMIAVSNIDFDLDIRGIFTAAIFIGCLGAVMDVGMSLASSMAEIKNANPSMSKHDLKKAGMRVGQDIMGTMANTLILAYTGGALMQMVVWKIYGYSFTYMLNREYITTEVIRALCGSLGMLLTIPITCMIATNIINLDIHALINEVE